MECGCGYVCAPVYELVYIHVHVHVDMICVTCNCTCVYLLCILALPVATVYYYSHVSYCDSMCFISQTD